MSIKIKVALVFLILLLSVVAYFLFNNYFMHRLVDETYLLNLTHQMEEEVLQIRRYEKNFILRGNAEWAELWKLHLSTLFFKIEDYRKLSKNKDIEKIERLLTELKSYNTAAENYIQIYKDKKERPELEIFISSGRSILRLCEQIKYESESSANRYMVNILKSQLAILIILILIGLGAFFVTCRWVVNPVKKLQQLCGTHILKNGNFNLKQIDLMDKLLDEADPKDEIGNLILSYREMALKCFNSYTSLKEKMKEIESLDKIKSEFTSLVSHELRTPLTAMRESIDFMLDGSTGEITQDQKKFLTITKKNVDRLTQLINEVLDFSKLTSKKFELKIEKANINDLIDSAVNTYKAEAEHKGLSLVTRLEATNGLSVWTDTDSVIRILTDLINNAVNFTAKGGVTVFTEKDETSNLVKVYVEDTGIGIRQEDIAKLFQPFVQVGDKKDRKAGTTGLGLAICRETIEQLGGRIWAESEFGKGSRFCFIIPIEERRKI